jgi:cytochrome P450
MSEQTLLFNPFDPDMAIDPYPHYRRLREAEPVHHSALGFWLLTRHADVHTFFADRDRLERRFVESQVARLGPSVEQEPYFRPFRQMLFILDDPDHHRVRQLFQKAFTSRRVADMRPRVQSIADGLIDAVEAQRSMDIISQFSYELPVRVIGSLLGVPVTDQGRIAQWAHDITPVFEWLPMDEPTLARANDATGCLMEYFRDLAAARRADPRDDLFTGMLHAAGDTGGYSEDEVLANALLMYFAGHETTFGAIGLAILALHRNPDQLDLLQRQPELLPGAVNELLRYDIPTQAGQRFTLEPVTFTDTEIPAGSAVVGYLGAANRDPEAYEDPDRLDITRPLGRPVTFGHGATLCIGHALARQELEVAIGTLLRRCPHMKLETLDPPFRATSVVRGVESLYVQW